MGGDLSLFCKKKFGRLVKKIQYGCPWERFEEKQLFEINICFSWSFLDFKQNHFANLREKISRVVQTAFNVSREESEQNYFFGKIFFLHRIRNFTKKPSGFLAKTFQQGCQN